MEKQSGRSQEKDSGLGHQNSREVLASSDDGKEPVRPSTSQTQKLNSRKSFSNFAYAANYFLDEQIAFLQQSVPRSSQGQHRGSEGGSTRQALSYSEPNVDPNHASVALGSQDSRIAYETGERTPGVARKASSLSEEQDTKKPAAITKSSKSSAVRSQKGRKRGDPDRPKRPLSAYNLFFQDQRALMLSEAEGSKQSVSGEEEDAKSSIGFARMARIISRKWKEIDTETSKIYEERAGIEKERYAARMQEYHKKQQEALERTRENLLAQVDEETKRQYFEGTE